MASMKAVQVSAPRGELQVVDRERPEPRENEVLIKVEACGICHGDAVVTAGHYPGIGYPRIPGHEVVGTVEKLGREVDGWRVGQRVGVGWHGGHCFTCPACRRGQFLACENSVTTGISTDGGYAEYMTARAEALVQIPGALPSVEIAPLLCAGRTTFGALQGSGARAGELVAVLGLGGLGRNGQAIVVAAAGDPITVPPSLLLGGGRSIKGSVEGNIEEAISFSLMAGVSPMVEVFPLSQAALAFNRMMTSKVHFRAVLKMGA